MNVSKVWQFVYILSTDVNKPESGTESTYTSFQQVTVESIHRVDEPSFPWEAVSP